MNNVEQNELNAESLEDVAMMVLNEDEQHDKAVDIERGLAGIGKGFGSGLGDGVDKALNAVQELRRKLQKYVESFPSSDGWDKYKKEVLNGCEIIQDAHYHFLNFAHGGHANVIRK